MPKQTTGKHVAEPTDEHIIREELYRTYQKPITPKRGRHS